MFNDDKSMRCKCKRGVSFCFFLLVAGCKQKRLIKPLRAYVNLYKGICVVSASYYWAAAALNFWVIRKYLDCCAEVISPLAFSSSSLSS